MRRNPPAKWVLPNTIYPTTSTEWCVPVPDDPFYRAAFLGALANLGAAYKWQDDPSHKAVLVAQVWRDIADNLERCMSEQPTPKIYEEDTMPFRVDCDCNVFVTCCDGTEIQLATLAQLQQTNQPGSGTRPQIGESTCYQRTLNAQNTWLLPFFVNTGDVLTVSNLSGAWTSDGLAWTCPDGTPMVGGLCIGSRYHVAGDPDGALFHGQLAYKINGVMYSATDGPFTVPMGITNASVTLIANLERVLSAAGDVVFKICAENGATPPPDEWCQYFDFTLSTYGLSITFGVFTPGVGIVGQDVAPGGTDQRLIEAALNPAWLVDNTLTEMVATYNLVKGFYSVDSPTAIININGVEDPVVYYSGAIDGDGQTITGANVPISAPANADIFLRSSRGDFSGTIVFTALTITGTGTNPFASSNC